MKCAYLVFALLAIAGTRSMAAQPPTQKGAPITGLAFLCSDMSGTYTGAPDWRPDADALTGQRVLIHFKGEGELGEIVWSRDGKEYSRSPGLGVSMKSGFALLVVADDRLETYVYSASTTELFFSQTRSGNDVLPNALKTYHGRCQPAGNLVR